MRLVSFQKELVRGLAWSGMEESSLSLPPVTTMTLSFSPTWKPRFQLRAQ
jgi:hypothetical protein